MSEDLKAQYARDRESGYPRPWELWQWIQLKKGCKKGCVWMPCRWAPRWDPNCAYRRIPNADQIILDWQRKKYAEDTEWHPRPWELWEYTTIDIDSGHWKRFGDDGADENPIFESGVRYRRRPDAPTREQWEAAQKETSKLIDDNYIDILENLLNSELGDKDCLEWLCWKKIKRELSKCATCLHEYESKLHMPIYL